MRDDGAKSLNPRISLRSIRATLAPDPPYEFQESETGLPRHDTQGLIQFAIFATAQRIPVYR